MANACVGDESSKTGCMPKKKEKDEGGVREENKEKEEENGGKRQIRIRRGWRKLKHRYDCHISR